MSSKKETKRELTSYQELLEQNQALLSENQAQLNQNHLLQNELQSLKMHLAEANELSRAISEGDLDALVITKPEGELIFTLDSADRAYRILVETMNEGTVTLACDGTIIYCNRSFAELMKMPSNTIVGTSIYRFIAPENLAIFKAFLKHDMGGEIKLQAEGDIFVPVYLSVSSLKEEESPNSWCLVFTDLTEQKKNEEIVAAERLARSIIEQAAEAIAVCDISGRITRFSNAMLNFFGCDPTFQRFEDIINLRFLEGTDAGKSILPVSSALKGSTILGVEATFELNDCEKFHLLLNSGPLKNDDGEIIGCVVTLVDITERKEAEAEIQKLAESVQQEKDKLLTLVNSIPDEVWFADAQKKISLVNPAVLNEFGSGTFDNSEVEAIAWSSEVYRPDGTPRPVEEAPPLRALKGEIIRNQEEIVRTPANGEIRYRQVNAGPVKDTDGNIIGSVSVVRNITERKKAEKELAAAHSQIQNIIDNTPDGIYAFDLEERFVLANTAIANVLNSTPDRMIGKRRHEFMPKMDADWHEANDRRVFEEGRMLEFEEYNYLEDRSITWLTKKFPLRDAQGRIYAVAGISADITERKQIEIALEKSEISLAEAQRIAHIGSWEWDIRTGKVHWSAELYSIYGLDPKTFVPTINSFADYIHPDDREFVNKIINQIVSDGKSVSFDFRIVLANGVTRILNVRGEIADFDENGKPCLMMGINQDITERKREEERIRRSNQILEGINQIFSTIVQAKTEEELANGCLSVALKVTGGGIGFINLVGDDGLMHDIAVSQMGWDQCLMYDKTGHRRPPGNFLSHGLYGHVVKSEKSFFTNNPQSHPESIGFPKDHPPLTSFLGVPLVLDGKTMGMVGVANRQGGYNREQQEDLETIASAMIQALHRKRSIEALHKAYEQIQMQSEELQTSYEELQAQSEEMQAQSEELQETNEALFKSEKRFRTLSESLKEKVKERTSELERAYESLKESENGLTEAQEIAHLGSWDWDIAANETYWSDETYRIFGLKPQELKATFDIFFSYAHPDDQDYLTDAVNKALNGESYSIDYRIILPGGERTVHSYGKVIFDEQNVPIRMKGTTQDITESIKAKEVLRSLNLYNRSLIEANLDPLVTIGHDGKITDVNKATELVTGYSRNELIGTDFSNYFTEPEKARTGYQQVFTCGEVRDYLLNIQHKHGHITPVLYNASVYRDEAGEIIGIFASARDITELKKVEEKIEVLANAVESSNDAIITESLEGIITSWNKGAEHIYGYLAEEVLGKDIAILEPANLKGEVRKLIEKIKQGKKVKNYETLRLKKDGTLINISMTISPVFYSSGKLVAISSIARDITESIKAQKALAEIDKLRIKEIHHRIKNNLQVISSLLDLQAETFEDEKVRESFRESQDRVVSMSLIHEELYKGGRADTLDFSAYLKKLAENLFQTYSLGSKNICLYMDIEENSFFDMDTAVPLGMIVNELVSNSLKHAFNENEEGKIHIKLCKEKKDNEIHKSPFSLKISDNGKGIPGNIELRNIESLGLQLVSILTDQLDGELELKRNQGTEFKITFEVDEKL